MNSCFYWQTQQKICSKAAIKDPRYLKSVSTLGYIENTLKLEN